ncbi:MAG: hypothetical protein IJO96_07470 [Oscillospiraceae bacterium]|nr:hypothetical protein [Oscillospiraceae bacterium]
MPTTFPSTAELLSLLSLLSEDCCDEACSPEELSDSSSLLCCSSASEDAVSSSELLSDVSSEAAFDELSFGFEELSEDELSPIDTSELNASPK